MSKSVARSERAYQHTKHLILSGRHPAGRLLSEGAIATELGISRTPVHEAFLRLDAERLIVLYPRKGAAALPMAPHEQRDVVEMREAIEASAVGRVIRDGTLDDEVLQRVRGILELGDTLTQSGAIEEFVDIDSDFHGALIEASGNVTAMHLYDVVRDRQARIRMQVLKVSPQNMAKAAAEHHGLLEAVLSRDEARYMSLLEQHLDYYRQH